MIVQHLEIGNIAASAAAEAVIQPFGARNREGWCILVMKGAQRDVFVLASPLYIEVLGDVVHDINLFYHISDFHCYSLPLIWGVWVVLFGSLFVGNEVAVELQVDILIGGHLFAVTV